MKRVLVTGMSGTGKSTVMRALAARGYRAIDTDSDEWCEWVETEGEDDPAEGWRNRDWVWREDRMRELLTEGAAGAEAAGDDGAEALFVSGCRSNQGKFYPLFDHIVLLSAPVGVLAERLAARTDNPYGKGPGELERVVGQVESVEPRLRRRATLEVDTRAPVEEVVEAILRHVVGAASNAT